LRLHESPSYVLKLGTQIALLKALKAFITIGAGQKITSDKNTHPTTGNAAMKIITDAIVPGGELELIKKQTRVSSEKEKAKAKRERKTKATAKRAKQRKAQT
jgi:hypothetical protein